MRSEPTELTPLVPYGIAKAIIQRRLSKRLDYEVVELWLRCKFPFISCEDEKSLLGNYLKSTQFMAHNLLYYNALI